MKIIRVCMVVLIITMLVSCNKNIIVDNFNYENDVFIEKMEYSFGCVMYADGEGNVWNWGKYATDGIEVNKNQPIPIKLDKIQGIVDFAVINSISDEAHVTILLNNKGELYQLFVTKNNLEDYGVSVELYEPLNSVKRILGISTIPPYDFNTMYMCVEKFDGTVLGIDITDLGLGSNIESLILPDNFGKIKEINLFGTVLNEDGEVWQRMFSDENDLYKKVEISDVKQIQSDVVTFLALKNDGTVWGWGDNGTGVLAYRRNSNEVVVSEESEVSTLEEPEASTFDEPIQIEGLANIDIISYNGRAGAIDKNGEVYTWGMQDDISEDNFEYWNKMISSYLDENLQETPETPYLDSHSPPKKLKNLENYKIKYIYTGPAFTSLVTENNVVLNRGLNFWGELGVDKETGTVDFEEIELK